MSFDDPFASTPKVASISWKGAPATDALLTLELEKAPEMVTYGKWPDGADKENVVVTGTVKKFTHNPQIVGETRSLWVPKGSRLFKAIASAQREAGGQRLNRGSVLHVKTAGETNIGGGKVAREWAAKHEPPAPVADDETPPF